MLPAARLKAAIATTAGLKAEQGRYARLKSVSKAPSKRATQKHRRRHQPDTLHLLAGFLTRVRGCHSLAASASDCPTPPPWPWVSLRCRPTDSGNQWQRPSSRMLKLPKSSRVESWLESARLMFCYHVAVSCQVMVALISPVVVLRAWRISTCTCIHPWRPGLE